MVFRKRYCVFGLLVAASAHAEEPGQVAARVVGTIDSVERQWVDITVEGKSEAALERCQRLVREAMRKSAAPSALVQRLERPCQSAPLPTHPPAADARILRTEEALAVVDLFAIGMPGTKGRI